MPLDPHFVYFGTFPNWKLRRKNAVHAFCCRWAQFGGLRMLHCAWVDSPNSNAACLGGAELDRSSNSFVRGLSLPHTCARLLTWFEAHVHLLRNVVHFPILREVVKDCSEI